MSSIFGWFSCLPFNTDSKPKSSSSVWPSFNSKPSTHRTIGVDRPMRHTSNRVSIYAKYSKVNQLSLINPFTCKVLSVVKTISNYPDPRDPVDVYDPQSVKFQPRLHFKVGSKLCVVGREGGYLIAYRLEDADRELGFFSPHLAKVDPVWVASLSPHTSPAPTFNDLEKAYAGSVMTMPSPSPYPPPGLPSAP